MTAQVHRLANEPPAGDPTNGKRQVLCGLYVLPDSFTIDSTAVTCGVCVKGEFSKRTVRQDRIATVLR